MFVIQHMMPLCMTVSWIYTVAIVVRSIVYEKEQRLKEVMKMMGLSNVVHWVAWFITSMSVMSVTVLFLTIILKVNSPLYMILIIVLSYFSRPFSLFWFRLSQAHSFFLPSFLPSFPTSFFLCLHVPISFSPIVTSIFPSTLLSPSLPPFIHPFPIYIFEYYKNTTLSLFSMVISWRSVIHSSFGCPSCCSPSSLSSSAS